MIGRLRLPAQVAARITIDLDNGDIDAPGFARDASGAYVRDGSFAAPLYDIHVDIDNGEVDLEIAY